MWFRNPPSPGSEQVKHPQNCGGCRNMNVAVLDSLSLVTQMRGQKFFVKYTNSSPAVQIKVQAAGCCKKECGQPQVFFPKCVISFYNQLQHRFPTKFPDWPHHSQRLKSDSAISAPDISWSLLCFQHKPTPLPAPPEITQFCCRIYSEYFTFFLLTKILEAFLLNSFSPDINQFQYFKPFMFNTFLPKLLKY